MYVFIRQFPNRNVVCNNCLIFIRYNIHRYPISDMWFCILRNLNQKIDNYYDCNDNDNGNDHVYTKTHNLAKIHRLRVWTMNEWLVG